MGRLFSFVLLLVGGTGGVVALSLNRRRDRRGSAGAFYAHQDFELGKTRPGGLRVLFLVPGDGATPAWQASNTQ